MGRMVDKGLPQRNGHELKVRFLRQVCFSASAEESEGWYIRVGVLLERSKRTVGVRNLRQVRSSVII